MLACPYSSQWLVVYAEALLPLVCLQAGSSIQHIVKRPGAAAGAEFLMREVRKAAVVVAADGDDDQLPDL